MIDISHLLLIAAVFMLTNAIIDRLLEIIQALH